MKKTTYPLYAMMKNMLVLAVATTLTFATACSKSGDDDGEESSELYTPPVNLSNAQIIDLLGTAYSKLAAENTFTITSVRTVTEEDNIVSSKLKRQTILNVAAKKALVIEYDLLTSPETFLWFNYIEDTTEYEYSYKKSLKITDAYFNNISVFINILPELKYYDWKVEGQRFVGTYVDGTRIKTVTIIQTKDMQYHTAKYTVGSLISGDTKGTVEEFTFNYDATIPAMPNGFSTAYFTPFEQFSVKVIWGEGQGENTFYSNPIANGKGYFSLDMLSAYIPSVTGKYPQYYSDSAFAHKIENSTIYLTDNNTVIYAKWVVK